MDGSGLTGKPAITDTVVMTTLSKTPYFVFMQQVSIELTTKGKKNSCNEEQDMY